MTTNDDCNGASVIKYLFNEEQVFAFISGDCGIKNPIFVSQIGVRIFDENCTVICSIHAELVELEDCEGQDFLEVAEELEVVWLNEF